MQKQCRPRSDCSFWSSLIRIYTICLSIYNFWMYYRIVTSSVSILQYVVVRCGYFWKLFNIVSSLYGAFELEMKLDFYVNREKIHSRHQLHCSVYQFERLNAGEDQKCSTCTVPPLVNTLYPVHGWLLLLLHCCFTSTVNI